MDHRTERGAALRPGLFANVGKLLANGEADALYAESARRSMRPPSAAP